MASSKILVVDDDKQFAKILEDWLNSRGFEAFVVHNGADALQAFENGDFAAVLLDALIPKMDGFKTCAAMRKNEHKKEIPIIMMSAIYRKPSESIRAKTECGATDFILKPVNLKDLYRRLTDYIAQS